MVDTPPHLPLHCNRLPLVNLSPLLLTIFSLSACLSPQRESLPSQAHVFFHKLNKDFFNRLRTYLALSIRRKNLPGQASKRSDRQALTYFSSSRCQIAFGIFPKAICVTNTLIWPLRPSGIISPDSLN